MGPIRIGLIVVAGLGAVAAAWYFWPAAQPPTIPPPVAQVKPAAAPESAPAEHYPVPESAEAEPAKPLPALDASDKELQDALAGPLGADALARFFVPERLVRNIVVTIDNLPRRTFAMRLSPLKPVGGLMATTGKDESLAIAPGNAARYAPWMLLLEKVDARKLVAVYVRFSPLFQKAYVELGYPKGHFNTRLVQVIDHLLTAPEPAAPVRLAVPHVLPEYADPALQSESAGRKVLFRIGNANAAKVKVKLREIRRELVKAR
ncbi:MAG TPA: DUF3014 domain-containing protein [Usitatibacteraceae bacterium]|nr:DUF3014 domain-containing protein [Usitatibacteraceae bacterium]